MYCAPEIYRSKEGYNRLVDMWSVGIVTYAGLSGTLPYDEKDVHRAEEIVRNKNLMYSHRRWRDVSPEAIDLISNKFLVVQPISRIRATVSVQNGSSRFSYFDNSFLGGTFSRMVY